MTESLVSRDQQVDALLEDNGYTRLPQRLDIGGVALEIDNAWNGPPGTLDLAIVTARPNTRSTSSQLYWGVQRLVRALEAADSQRTLTVILIGADETPGPETRRSETELQTLARVLIADPDAPVDRALAPLIQLELPSVEERELDGVGMVEDTIHGVRRAVELTALLTAAKDGSRAVEARYMAWIDQAFSSTSGAN